MRWKDIKLSNIEISCIYQRQSKLEEQCQLGYEAAKLLEEEEKIKENQQLEEDQRMAELLSQEFILQQIVTVYIFILLIEPSFWHCCDSYRKAEKSRLLKIRRWLKD